MLDTRPIDDERSIRRRRECLNCQHRFTSYETIERGALVVCKRDNKREAFNRDKIMSGIKKACQKRPVTEEQMVAIVDDMEADFKNGQRIEVSTVEIGERIMAKLRELDDVAYIRFCSVYREFNEADAFIDELNNLKKMKASQGDEDKK